MRILLNLSTYFPNTPRILTKIRKIKKINPLLNVTFMQTMNY